jgi:5'-nucleotidase
MAIRYLLREDRPTLVLSGVNRGANMADDVTYSGTIAGAIEGTLLGVRSVAMSLATGFQAPDSIQWDTARAHGPEIVRRLLASEWDTGVLMNVNFPDRAPDDIAGIAVTEQGRRDQDLMKIDQRTDTWGNPYYWLGSLGDLHRPGFDHAAEHQSHGALDGRAAGARTCRRAKYFQKLRKTSAVSQYSASSHGDDPFAP